jgi:uncharacterized membrane protein
MYSIFAFLFLLLLLLLLFRYINVKDEKMPAHKKSLQKRTKGVAHNRYSYRSESEWDAGGGGNGGGDGGG